MNPKCYRKFFGNPLFGHSVSVAFMPVNWIVGIAFGPKWVALHFGPFNVFWHRPKEQRPVGNVHVRLYADTSKLRDDLAEAQRKSGEAAR